LSKKRKYPLLIFGLLLGLALLMVACSGSSTQEAVENNEPEQDNQVVLPVSETKPANENETIVEEAEDSYPTPEEEANVDAEAYPVPEVQPTANTTGDAYPVPEEQAAKPTPRGSDLVATNPTSVNLASGQLQLVEMFAFW
jgi:hypothetical protein